MISFANPFWLYGLFGLLIPIGIHLLSRKEGKTIYIGSIRHLTDSDTAQFSSIRLNEFLLLLLRILLITIVVFILAGFSFNSKGNQSKQWLLIEKGIERDKAYSQTIDDLSSKGFEVRSLSDDFPVLSDSGSISPTKNYAELIHSLPSFVDTAVIMTYSYASAFKGEKPSLPRHVSWLTVDPPPVKIATNAVESGVDSVAVRVLTSNAFGSEFSNTTLAKSAFNKFPKTDTLEVNARDTINISIYASESFGYDSKIIQAALQAIANRTPHYLKIASQSKATEISPQTDFLFWLAEEPAPKTKVLLGYSRCTNTDLPLLLSSEHAVRFCPDLNFDWIITQHLTEENVLNESFTSTLATLILPSVDSKSFASFDHRILAADAVFSKSEVTRTHSSTERETKEPELAVLLFVVLLTERFIAYKRKQ